MIHLSQISSVVNGQLNQQRDVIFNGVSINTRTDCEQCLFIALKGKNFDAHDFISQAEQAGSSALMLEREVETRLPSILVDDTHQALTDLATWWRQQFTIPLIGVTGSVGKTSVKEMLGSIFAQLGQGVVTQGNLNNEIGVPLTLMRLDQGAQYAIVEMGMNHAGEISRITATAKPTIALINNAAAAHLEGLGSIEAVAKAKGEIFEGLSDDGVAIINNDDVYAPLWKELAAGHRIITFALESDADVTASYQVNGSTLLVSVDAMGKRLGMRLSAIGEHNVRNALAAIAASLAANVSIENIQAGLEAYRPISGRLNLTQVGAAQLIDDTYNANPLSMLAAIKVLVQYPNNTLIVGDMAELGNTAQEEHRKLGQSAAEYGVERILACGEYANLVIDEFKQFKPDNSHLCHAFTEQNDLIDYLTQQVTGGTILVKGSRSAKMEHVVSALNKSLSTPELNTGRKREC